MLLETRAELNVMYRSHNVNLASLYSIKFPLSEPQQKSASGAKNKVDVAQSLTKAFDSKKYTASDYFKMTLDRKCKWRSKLKPARYYRVRCFKKTRYSVTTWWAFCNLMNSVIGESPQKSGWTSDNLWELYWWVKTTWAKVMIVEWKSDPIQ